MKHKTKFLAFLLILPLLVGCNSSSSPLIDDSSLPRSEDSGASNSSLETPSDDSSSAIEHNTITFNAVYDYGFHIEGVATMLLNDSLIFFNPLAYDIAPLVGGDKIVVEYSGEMLIRETYPSTVSLDGVTIHAITRTHGILVEYEVMENPGEGEYSLVTFDPDYQTGVSVTQNNVVDRDGGFRAWNTYPAATKIYGIIAASANKNNVSVLYDYNPFL